MRTLAVYQLGLFVWPWIVTIGFCTVQNSSPQVVILGVKSDDFEQFDVLCEDKYHARGSFVLYVTSKNL